MTPRATVLIPTFDHGPLLAFAIRSVQAQTVDDFELFVIGDGVGDDTRDLMRDVSRDDERIRFSDNPKGERLGEAHRRPVLAAARGAIVCYLCDDDLWVPEHLAVMEGLLADADFAHSRSVAIMPDGSPRTWLLDLSDPVERGYVVDVHNRIQLSTAGHTLAAYGRLPYGWRPAPPDSASDWHMFRQILGETWVRAVSGDQTTVVTFPSPWRLDHTPAQRLAELEVWEARIRDARWRADELPRLRLEATVNSWRDTDRRLMYIVRSTPWLIAVRPIWWWRSARLRWKRRRR